MNANSLIEKKFEECKQWTTEKRNLIDGKEHSISEKIPSMEYSAGDYSMSLNSEMTRFDGWSEIGRYYVEAYIHGDREKKIIARHITYDDKVYWKLAYPVEWHDGYRMNVNADDIWVYTTEAFEVGIKKAEAELKDYVVNGWLSY